MPEASLFTFVCDEGLNILDSTTKCRPVGESAAAVGYTRGSRQHTPFTVNQSLIGIESAFLADLGASVEAIRHVKPSEVKQAMHEELTGEVTEQSLFNLPARLGIDPAHLPKRMAIVNEVFGFIARPP